MFKRSRVRIPAPDTRWTFLERERRKNIDAEVRKIERIGIIEKYKKRVIIDVKKLSTALSIRRHIVVTMFDLDYND